jgi:hypothetical protein
MNPPFGAAIVGRAAGLRLNLRPLPRKHAAVAAAAVVAAGLGVGLHRAAAPHEAAAAASQATWKLPRPLMEVRDPPT